MADQTVIAEQPPNDGRDWDSQCARCGGSTDYRECEQCGGDGETAPGELYEQDPLWYDEDDVDPCSLCLGRGGWTICGNPAAWCEAHPRPGREQVERGTLEWFVVPAQEVSGG